MPAFAAIIAIAGTWAYAPSFDGVFLLDDIRAVVQNQTIGSIGSAFVPPPQSTVSGRPVANLSFAINRALASPDALAWNYHAGNLLIHLATALLLFGIVRRTLRTDRMRAAFGDAADWAAFATALLWVVHPLNTEAVTYIVQRVESLMSLFFALTLYCAIRAAEAPGASGSSRESDEPVASGFSRKSWLAAAVLSSALGMGTKEVMVGVPLAVLAWDWVFLRRPRWHVFAWIAATWLVLGVLVFYERRMPSIALDAATAWHYLLTQSAVIVRYLRLAFVPNDLVFLYTWPLVSSLGDVLLPALMVSALAALTAFGLVKRHPAAFAGAVFFIVLAPSSSVLPIVTEVAAEHRMYLPLAALIAAIVAALGYAIHRRGDRLPFAAAALVVVTTVLLGTETRARNRVYADDETLWADVVSKQGANQRARVAYGSILASRRKVDEAAAQFKAAVDLNGSDPMAQARLGSALAAQGRFDEAVQHLDRALAIRPDDVEAHRTLGQIYAARQEDARALPHLLAAADAVPDPSVLTRIAAILAESRDPDLRDARRAVPFADRAVSMTNRQDPVALAVLSAALAGSGRLPEAAATAREAIPLASAQGNAPLAAELDRRARAYGGG